MGHKGYTNIVATTFLSYSGCCRQEWTYQVCKVPQYYCYFNGYYYELDMAL